jgi:hypothetical protein
MPPTLVQHVSTASSLNPDGAFIASELSVPLAMPSLSGNCLIVAVVVGTASGAATITASDDKGNTYTAGPSNVDAASDEKCAILYALNATAGVTKITLHFSSACNYVSACASEFSGVATSSAIDGSHGAHGSGTSWAAGSFTPTTSGDLIYSVAFQYSDFPSGSTISPGSGFKLLHADRNHGSAAQYQVQTTAGAINPTITSGASRLWFSLAMGLKAAAAGTPGSGIRVVRRSVFSYAADGPSSFTNQFPADTGNLLVAAWDGFSDSATACHITAVSDSASNTWSVKTAADSPAAAPGSSQFAYATSASPSGSMTVSVTLNTAMHDCVVVLYEVAGANASPFDIYATTSGNQAGTGSLSSVSITPSQAGGLVFACCQVDSSVLTGCTTSDPATYFDCSTYPEQDAAPPDPLEQDNGRAHVLPSGTSALTFSWSKQAAVAAGNWSAAAISFKAAAGSSTLTAAAGSFAETGVAASLKAARKLTASAGTFAETGRPAGLIPSRKLAASAGSFAEAGSAATLLATRRIAASVGSFAETGSSAGLLAARKAIAAAGSFAEAGAAASLLASRKLVASAGSYSETGIAAGLLAGRKLSASAGSFASTGNAATLTYTTVGHYTLTAGAGAFAETGVAATLRAARKGAAAPGTFAESGNPATLTATRRLTASAGAFSEAGQSAGLLASRKVVAAAGSFVESGSAASLIYTPVGQFALSAGAGSFAETGVPASLRATRRLTAAPGSLIEAGNPAGLAVGRKVGASPGTFAETGLAASFVYRRAIAASPGQFTLAGHIAGLAYTGAPAVPWIFGSPIFGGQSSVIHGEVIE